MTDLYLPGAKAAARLLSRNEGVGHVFKRDEGRDYFWDYAANKTNRRSVRPPVTGDLIRDQNNPCYINIVHEVEILGDTMTVLSTRLYHIVSGRVTLLDNTRARPFDWNKASWEIVRQYSYLQVDDKEIRDAALRRSFETYSSREEQD